jgi:hypothetical protein
MPVAMFTRRAVRAAVAVGLFDEALRRELRRPDAVRERAREQLVHAVLRDVHVAERPPGAVVAAEDVLELGLLLDEREAVADATSWARHSRMIRVAYFAP